MGVQLLVAGLQKMATNETPDWPMFHINAMYQRRNMEKQLRLNAMNEVTIENEWLTKYPPSRVGPDILGNRFESIAIPSDGVAMIIEDVDRWIDWQTKDTELTRPIDVGPVLISWGVLAIVRSWNSVSDAIINHACGEISQTIGCGADVNSRRYPHGEPRIESRVILDGGIGLLIATYFIGLHTEVKLARDIELTPRYGCLE